MRRALAALPALLLVGCGEDAVELPADALSEVREVAGSASDSTVLDLDSLATMANVEPEVIASTAPSLTEGEVWSTAMDGVRRAYQDAPDGVAPTLVDVACGATTGAIYTEYQLHYAIFQRVQGFDEKEIDGLTNLTSELYSVLSEAGTSDEPEDRASAVLTCHALEEARR